MHRFLCINWVLHPVSSSFHSLSLSFNIVLNKLNILSGIIINAIKTILGKGLGMTRHIVSLSDVSVASGLLGSIHATNMLLMKKTEEAN